MINLDPAADDFKYPVSGDVRTLICLPDVMEEMNLGPNGALLYCMEYLEDNLEDWLSMTLEGYADDDCVILTVQVKLSCIHTTRRFVQLPIVCKLGVGMLSLFTYSTPNLSVMERSTLPGVCNAKRP